MLFLFFLRLWKVDLLPTNPFRFNSRPIILIFSVLFSILILVFLPGKSIKKILHLLWLIPTWYLFFFFTPNWRYFEKLDFLLSKKVNFKVEQHVDNETWLSNYILIENSDTVFYNQHRSFENWLTKQDIKKLELRKSLTQNYYHLRNL